jgi:hypothetical protein
VGQLQGIHGSLLAKTATRQQQLVAIGLRHPNEDDER